jgi:hypothetical protein
MYASSALVAAVAFAGSAVADFHIYHVNTIQAAPDLAGGYEAFFNNLVRQ